MNADIIKDGDAAPFTFDVNFSAPKSVEPTYSHAEYNAAIKAAEARAYERGMADGRAEEEGRLASEAKRIADAASGILAAIDQDRVRLERECADLSFKIAKTLASEALVRFPTDEIEKLISDCLGPLRETPHLVVRLCERDVTAITETVGKLAREAGFEGRFVVLGEPGFAPGDCRIEWADGGIVRDRAAAEEAIDTLMKTYFTTPPESGSQIDPADDGTRDPANGHAGEANNLTGKEGRDLNG